SSARWGTSIWPPIWDTIPSRVALGASKSDPAPYVWVRDSRIFSAMRSCSASVSMGRTVTGSVLPPVSEKRHHDADGPVDVTGPEPVVEAVAVQVGDVHRIPCPVRVEGADVDPGLGQVYAARVRVQGGHGVSSSRRVARAADRAARASRRHDRRSLSVASVSHGCSSGLSQTSAQSDLAAASTSASVGSAAESPCAATPPLACSARWGTSIWPPIWDTIPSRVALGASKSDPAPYLWVRDSRIFSAMRSCSASVSVVVIGSTSRRRVPGDGLGRQRYGRAPCLCSALPSPPGTCGKPPGSFDAFPVAVLANSGLVHVLDGEVVVAGNVGECA